MTVGGGGALSNRLNRIGEQVGDWDELFSQLLLGLLSTNLFNILILLIVMTFF